MDLLATAQILRIDTGEELFAQLPRNHLDPIDERQCHRLQNDLLGAPIIGRNLPTDQPLRLETIQQAGQGRPLYTYALGQFALSRYRLKAGQMQQHQPTCLRQSQAR